jgi:hypothetical protein
VARLAKRSTSDDHTNADLASLKSKVKKVNRKLSLVPPVSLGNTTKRENPVNRANLKLSSLRKTANAAITALTKVLAAVVPVVLAEVTKAKTLNNALAKIIAEPNINTAKSVNSANPVSLVSLVNAESPVSPRNRTSVANLANPACLMNNANPVNPVNTRKAATAEAREDRVEVTAVASAVATGVVTVLATEETAVAIRPEEFVAAEVNKQAVVAECRTLMHPSLRTEDNSTDSVPEGADPLRKRDLCR